MWRRTGNRTTDRTNQGLLPAQPEEKEKSHILSSYKKSEEPQTGRWRKCPMAMEESGVRRTEVMKRAFLG